MTPKEQAKHLVNEEYYQPITLHLNVTNNSKQMWDYAKRCAIVAVDILIAEASDRVSTRGREGISNKEYWQFVKAHIELL